MNALTIVKTYPDGKTPDGIGFYRWVLTKTTITESDMMKYELSCPFIGNKSILLGVKRISCKKEFTNINPIASELLKQNICGDCVFVFPHDEEEEYMKFTDKEYDVICEIIKRKLLQLGANPLSFMY